MTPTCTYDGCSKKNFARGYCSGHAAQLRRGQELKPLRQPRPSHTDTEAWCSTCKVYHPFENFSWDNAREDWQRVCRIKANAKQQARGKVRESSRQYYVDNRESMQVYHNSRKYNLSPETYQQLHLDHPLCAICGREPDSNRRFAIDHNHETGALRGLLCLTCNSLLGYARDDIVLLEKAIEYLRSGGPLSTLSLTVEGELLI
jgi:hypothetical protein